ncbi:hypothetical protein [Spongiimicrobium salis]|uniref:hypothetical protein n=1 Tax=Spongiimicrobium salis TaxID=1667022 RepID=UPI00374CBBFE
MTTIIIIVTIALCGIALVFDMARRKQRARILELEKRVADLMATAPVVHINENGEAIISLPPLEKYKRFRPEIHNFKLEKK